MSQVPQVPQGGPNRPQPSSDGSKPMGRTSEKFTRLIKEVEATDAEKQGKRRERPKLEEEPEAAEVEVSFAEEAIPSAATPTSVNIPQAGEFTLTDDEAITGLGAPTSIGYGDDWSPPEDEVWTPPPAGLGTPSIPYSETESAESVAGIPARAAARRKKPVDAGEEESQPTRTVAAKKVIKKAAAAVVPEEAVTPLRSAKQRATIKRTSRKAVGEAAVTSTLQEKKEPGRKAAAKKPVQAKENAKPAEAAPTRRSKTKVVAPETEEPAALKKAIKEKSRKRQEAEREASEAMAPGLPYLAQAALHHVSSVPSAHGSKVAALSGRPLPTIAVRGVAGGGAVAGPSGTTLTRSAGVERVLAALRAAVLTLEQQTDKRALTITLKGDPRLAGTALEGLKIRVEEFAAAPKQYNITMESSPEAQALLSGAAADMADQLNRLGRERGWSVQRLDVQVGRPLFHRKEASDMGGGAGGGRGGKTR